MGRIKGWKKTFDSPDHISYQTTEDIIVNNLQMSSVFPKDGSIMVSKNYGTGEWNTTSEPEGYSIDERVFTSKKKATDALIGWMKLSRPVSPETKVTPKGMTITLSAYKYMDIVYLQGEEDEATNFLENHFIDGWKGVKKEFPTLDRFEWGFVTSEMFHDEKEFNKLSEFLSMPIEYDIIELSAPEQDPVRAKLESKVRIIWK